MYRHLLSARPGRSREQSGKTNHASCAVPRVNAICFGSKPSPCLPQRLVTPVKSQTTKPEPLPSSQSAGMPSQSRFAKHGVAVKGEGFGVGTRREATEKCQENMGCK